MADKFRWGIIGPGNIAKAFATGLTVVEGAEIVAVGGRNMDKVNAFADEFGPNAKRYNSYKEVAEDPSVDAVYIAALNPFHFENIMLCIENGKAVLCEKPMCLNYSQAQKAVAAARAKKVFLMEAIWSRFLPIYDTVHEWIRDGKIGEIRMAQANLGFNAPWKDGDRHIAPELGGGSIMDVGVYNLAFLRDVIGAEPVKVQSTAVLGATGVDYRTWATLEYPGGVLASATTSIDTDMPQDGWIYGSKATIHLKNYWRTTSAALIPPWHSKEEPTVVEAGWLKNGYEYEAMEVQKQVRAGNTESPRMPLDESLAFAKTIQEMRDNWGVKFPGEEA
ncbi:Gfo/Idh/MocA family oxidoreductase [Ruminococcaceae bacterium OttesenSCG-928-D13]|nr:Gfo/Idh/MocA family oxidoreductase [Ruminococcaceae bacterium OttesenSCG-928-D13]